MSALVKTPLTRAMEDGSILRLEELTRMGSDAQDTLITVLSEKILPIPELDTAIEARPGFNVIATANNRERASTSSLGAEAALQRGGPAVARDDRGGDRHRRQARPRHRHEPETAPIRPADEELARIVTLFRELRDGRR